MGRDLGKPKKTQVSTGKFAGLPHALAGLPMKQIPNACIRWRLRNTQPEQRLRPKRTTKTAHSTRSFTGEH
jgi:hypothetical protein